MASSVTATTYPSARNDSTESKLKAWATSLDADGVLWGVGNQLALFADSSGMQVKLPSGATRLGGIRGDLSAQTALDIGAPDASNPRIDTVVAELKRTPSPYTITYKVIPGTPAGSPVAPTLTNNATYKYLAIGDVRVEPSPNSTIAANKITLRRTFAGDSGILGWVPTITAEPGAGYLVNTDYVSLPGAAGRYWCEGMRCYFRWSVLLTFTNVSSAIPLLVTTPVPAALAEDRFVCDAQEAQGRAIMGSFGNQIRVIPSANWNTDGTARWTRIQGFCQIAPF